MAKKSNDRVYIGGKTFAKASLSDLLDLSAEDIGKLTKSQSIRLEKRLYKEAERRLKTIYSHGYRSMIAEYNFGDIHPQKPTEKATIYATKHRVTALKDFLENKRSTYTGLRKYYKEEEARIFGKSGFSFNSEDERTRFWRAYDEFMHQNPAFYDQSTRVQQAIGRTTFWRQHDFTADDLSNVLRELMKTDNGVDIRADVGYSPVI